jgi:hypothetical protein
MIISSAGAEGISLTCVRQVHILEPYWNFVRINQVFGRAIRLKSHNDLEPSQRNVEKYIYLSTIPYDDSIEEIYKNIKEWPDVPDIKLSELKIELSKPIHKNLKDLIYTIFNIKTSIDEDIFEIMERKNKLSETIIDIIKQSSLDCIRHTRDTPQLNNQCIRFSNSLLHEIAYFPGIASNELFQIDKRQLKATFQVFVEPDNYIVSGETDNTYLYFQVSGKSKREVDVRYIRENYKKICELNLDRDEAYVYEDSTHKDNETLGKLFSVYQSIYLLNDFKQNINVNQFPSLKDILQADRIGLIIKYNENNLMFFSPNRENSLLRLYKYDDYLENKPIKPLIVCNSDVFIQA